MLLFLHFPRAGPGGVRAAAFNAALFGAFGVIHSALARERPKKIIASLVGATHVRPVYVAIGGVTLSCLLYLWRPLAGTFWCGTGLAYWVLSLLFLAAVAGLFYTATCIDYLEFLGIRSLLRSARGQPPKPPVFSAKGPYAYCRHPMYSFLLIALWIGPVMTIGRFEFAALASVYLFAGTLFEERNLRQELGAVYDAYAANVPMWIPRLSPWIPQRDILGRPSLEGGSRPARSLVGPG
jgi:protein-S-isoprenylcysteine O-methyltransferase Ste14